ncbi:helix-turn-helix domain-containing protein [Gordonia aichiensis]|uniref:Helix-turn-helix domain-containing protein n=1 Tax=Gordonia aichiensis NBRC 108223 TaxID=1220583 RepID=L7KG87_9ACTN|nr:helix-turn-helix domain-containing protein [Gordonia aichiensis]GAC47481.1 hypothetical protein GOACH_03_05030 [Gordonia aichiensis NBRC 108223]
MRKWSKFQWYKDLRGCRTHITPVEYLVLTMLANYAGDDGRNARPSVGSSLAPDCGMDTRHVRRTLAALVDKGYLVLTERGGNRRGYRMANVYALVRQMPHMTPEADADANPKGGSDYPPSPDGKGGTDCLPSDTGKGGTHGQGRGAMTGREGRYSLPTHQISNQIKDQGASRSADDEPPAGTPHTPTPESPKNSNPTEQTVEDDPEPASRCQRHRSIAGPVDEPCRPCRDTRLAHEAWQTRQAQRAAATKAERQRALVDCDLCDDHGWRLGPDGTSIEPVERCTHQRPAPEPKPRRRRTPAADPVPAKRRPQTPAQFEQELRNAATKARNLLAKHGPLTAEQIRQQLDPAKEGSYSSGTPVAEQVLHVLDTRLVPNGDVTRDRTHYRIP